MSTPQSYNLNAVNFEREMERLRVQLMLTWQQEARQLYAQNYLAEKARGNKALGGSSPSWPPVVQS